MLLREASSETYGPRVYFPSYKFPIYFILESLLSNLYHKNTKNIILSYLSDPTLVSDREGIDNPLSRWSQGVICFVQVLGTRVPPDPAPTPSPAASPDTVAARCPYLVALPLAWQRTRNQRNKGVVNPFTVTYKSEI